VGLLPFRCCTLRKTSLKCLPPANNIIHPTRQRIVYCSASCCGRVMMSVRAMNGLIPR